MDKSRILKTFNNHFEEFIDDILRVFPDDEDLLACRSALLSMRKMNPKILLSGFQQTMFPYKVEIINNDLAFFIEKDYKKEITFSKKDFGNQVLQKIDMIRSPIKNMCDTDKCNVSKYLNNLLKLAELYNS
jgi:hypothetical protein